MNNMIINSPAVFSVGEEYKIFVRVAESSVMWVKIGDKCYYDHSNGILRSAVTIHKISVPMSELDKAKKYTVCYRRMIERKPYFSETGDIEEVSFAFSPIDGDDYNIYHLSDTHGMVEAPTESAKRFEEKYGKINLLILNGDIIDHSGDIKNFDTIYEIASIITKGEIPIVFSRGNHDTRGIYAEIIADYTPTKNGNSYFSFRLGSLWGLVLDCGEDKLDTHEEYGNTMCCHEFRKEETRYIESIIENASSEYKNAGVKRKIVIAHSPFTQKFKPPFNIEEDTYAYWTSMLKNSIKPSLIICGHTHKLNVSLPGDEKDAYAQPCPVVIASVPFKSENRFIGGGFVINSESVKLVYADAEKILEEREL